MTTTTTAGTLERVTIATERAPAAIGTYSQAVRIDNTVYISGQIPLVPSSMALVGEDFAAQAEQVFKNLSAVCEAAGGSLNEIAKLTVYLMDLGNFATVNETMERFFEAPFPARAAVQVAGLPKGALIEVDAIMALPLAADPGAP